MAHTQKLKSAARFDSRYGRRIRDLVTSIESQYKNKKLKCPYCNYEGVKRLSYGIWECRKCGKVFTGKAYTI